MTGPLGSYRVSPDYTMAQMAGRFDLAAGAWDGLLNRFSELTMNEYDLGVLGKQAGIVGAYDAAREEMLRKLREGRDNLTRAGDALYEVRATYAHVEVENERVMDTVDDE